MVREIRESGKAPVVQESTSGALAGALQHDFPEVESAIRIWSNWPWIRYQDRVFQHRFFLVDEAILDVFTLPLVRGDRETVFRDPYSLLITEEMAEKCFGDTDPIGQAITVENRYFGGQYTVTGILKNPPRKSTFQFDFLFGSDRNARIQRIGPLSLNYESVKQTFLSNSRPGA